MTDSKQHTMMTSLKGSAEQYWGCCRLHTLQNICRTILGLLQAAHPGWTDQLSPAAFAHLGGICDTKGPFSNGPVHVANRDFLESGSASFEGRDLQATASSYLSRTHQRHNLILLLCLHLLMVVNPVAVIDRWLRSVTAIAFHYYIMPHSTGRRTVPGRRSNT
jgi:hypothetical protein